MFSGRAVASQGVSDASPGQAIDGRWPSGLERRFAWFFWADPRVILDPDITRDQFARAVCVGGAIKITGGNRHPVADQMLIDATIVDIGASDGSTSVDLIGKLAAFKRYVIAALHFHLTAVDTGRRCLFYDGGGTLILGRWMPHSHPITNSAIP